MAMRYYVICNLPDSYAHGIANLQIIRARSRAIVSRSDKPPRSVRRHV